MFEVMYTVQHSHHLVLMVDIGSCLQQSLDCLGVSLSSSYLQRNTAILYERMRDKKTVIAGGHHCYRTERRKREPNSKVKTIIKGKSLVHMECSIQVHKRTYVHIVIKHVPRQ